MKPIKILLFVISLLFFNTAYSQFEASTQYKVKFGDYNAIEFSEDGRLFSSIDGTNISIWFSGSNSIYKAINPDIFKIYKQGFIDENKIYIIGRKSIITFDGIIQIWNLEKNTKEFEYSLKNELINDCVFDSQLKYAYFSTNKNNLYFYSILDKKNNATIKEDTKILSVTITKDNDLLCIALNNNLINIRKTTDGSLSQKLEINQKIHNTTFGSRGDMLAAVTRSGNIILFSYINHKFEKLSEISPQSSYWPYCIAFSKDDKIIFTSSKKRIYVWDVNEKIFKLSYKIRREFGINAIDVDPKGKYFATKSITSNIIRLWDVSSLGITPTIKQKNSNDKMPPQILVTEPSMDNDRVSVTDEEISIRGVALDDAGISKVFVNGFKIETTAKGEFEFRQKLSIGENNFTVEAHDINGNIALKKVAVIRSEIISDPEKLKSKNYMLVIGIDRYKYWPKLSNAVFDAKAIIDVLTQKYGFEKENIYTLFDSLVTRQSFIATFKSLINKIGPNDKLVIYYSGHGQFDSQLNEGYWIPYNAKTDDESEFIPNSYLMQLIKSINSKHTLLIADACFSGSLFIESSRGFKLNNFKSRWGIASGRLELVSDGAIGEHSPFNKSLVEMLDKNTNANLPVNEILDQIKNNILKAGKQIPIGNPLKNSGDEGGTFTFELKQLK